MRKISEMYRRSGGTSYTHHCSDCADCVSIHSGNKQPYKCQKYGGDERDHRTDWNPKWIACRFFREPAVAIQHNTSTDCSTVQPIHQFRDLTKTIERYECDGQMSIFDYGGI